MVSYEHAYELVHGHGETGWTAHLIPLTVDGFIWASSMLDSARRIVQVPRLAWWPAGRCTTCCALARQLSDAEAGERTQAEDRLLGYYLTRTLAAHAHLHALAGQPGPAEFRGRDDALAWLDADRPNLIAAVALAAAADRDDMAMSLALALGEHLAAGKPGT